MRSIAGLTRVTPLHGQNSSHLLEQLGPNLCYLPAFLTMQYDRIIQKALRGVQSILCANLPPAHNLPDDRAVASLRALINAAVVQEAMKLGSDTALCFVLRAVNHIVSDSAQAPRAMIYRLWDVLDEPELNRALGNKQNSRMMVWRKKPHAR